MGRLSEYEDAEVYLETAGRHEALGRRVEALLASEEPPEGLDTILERAPYLSVGQLEFNVWTWFRKQLLAPGSLATGGATGEDDGR